MMCCVHCRTCWQPQEPHLTALSSCFNKKKKKKKKSYFTKCWSVLPCHLVLWQVNPHTLCSASSCTFPISFSLMKIPTGKYVGAAEGAVWVCVAAKHLTKVSFCSENLGIICHFFCYWNSSSWTEGVAGLCSLSRCGVGGFFFPLNWFSSAHVQLYFRTLICALDGFWMCSGSCWVLAEGKELKLKKKPSHSLKSENRHCPEWDAFENHHLVGFCCNKFGLCKLRGMNLGCSFFPFLEMLRGSRRNLQ